ncbi:hypothetical protein [Ornithinimicrobium avium]|uniref:Uncharacterized protein n=1 Tax=Ornithinimicrobium avium TaxID=2283195 RepID=A0A345NM92_9MICO|nr:hypothetical protein [Ornithinimicrobium avium]AXH96150.1 hypothetical protein DV701_08415 [Ornithinimicrobium avium]
MTTTHAEAARQDHAVQWVRVARLLTTEALRHLFWAIGVLVAIVVVGSLVAWWQGWEIVPADVGPAELFVQVTADTSGVRIVASWVVFVVGAAIAAIVNQAVLASRTRVLVGAGATRRSVATGLVSSMLAMTALVLVYAGVVLLVVGAGHGPGVAAAGASSGSGLLLLMVRLTGALVLGMTGAMLVVALFQRWQWWVGAVVLAVFFWVAPALLAIVLPPVWAWLEAAAGWWGSNLVLAVGTLVVYWLVARRVPVR